MDLTENKPQHAVVEVEAGRKKEMRVLVMGMGRAGTTGKATLCNPGNVCQTLKSRLSFGIRTQRNGFYPL